MRFRRGPERCSSAGRVTAQLLLSFLALSDPATAQLGRSSTFEDAGSYYTSPLLPPVAPAPREQSPVDAVHEFTLRHLFHHGAYLYPTLHRKKDILSRDADIWMLSEDGEIEKLPPLIIKSRSTRIQRLADRRTHVVDTMVAAGREHGEAWTLSPTAWSMDEISGPNVTDKDTVVAMAQMAANAYVEEPYTSGWEDIRNGFNNSADFGWESDGLRGHVFANDDNSTIIISVKGTTMAVYDGADTTTNDKENDNLFFSCCCGQQGTITHRKVCDCATGTYSCNTTCVSTNLRKENRYYAAARHLYSNVTALYPDSEVWLTGHSLGGAVSSFLGLTYGLPTVTYESPPDALAAGRLGLPAPPGTNANSPQTRAFTGVYHFGHTADPLYLGTCTGVSSLCSFAGYAMESACHSGLECVYDVVGDKGWRVGIGTHSIRNVIRDVLKVYDTVPECVATPECVDCPLWRMYESNGSDTTTSTSTTTTSKTRTRTETCKTPGWWGCLDESTTTSAMATTTSEPTTTTSTTSSCKTPGWFGCRDETTTIATSTKSGSFTPTATSTTTCDYPDFWGDCDIPGTTDMPTSTPVCQTPSFWGCKDERIRTTKQHVITSPPPLPSTTTNAKHPTKTKTKCTSREWFGLICVDPSSTTTTTATLHPVKRPSKLRRCVKRQWWFGVCKEYGDVEEPTINMEM